MDTSLAKMYWFTNSQNSWQFLWAGLPSNTDLILENVRQELLTNTKALTRERIQHTVRKAYRKRLVEWIADYALAPYDMSMAEFKREGKTTFTDEIATKLARDIEDAAASFREEVMVVGWGKTPISVMIYGINQSESWSGSLTGLGAIGAGREVAMSSLLLHGITRNSCLEDVLYAVAAAKFAAERCDGVGRSTTISVSRKPRSTDGPEDKADKWLTNDEVDGLRRLWEEHGRPRIPDEGQDAMLRIAQRITGGVSIEAAVRHVQATMRKARQSASRKSVDQQ